MLHQDHELGTLEPGKLADMVILTADPLQSSVEALDDIDVLLTFVGGVIEYDREADL
jgi:predicted amidohydrolase YtcJ